MVESQTTGIPTPQVKRRSGPSMVWLIPLLTLMIGGWLVVKTLSEQGPQVIITFKTAEGIEAGKTKIKYKNVEIGIIDNIQFSDDFSHVLLTANFSLGTASFLKRDTRFWVVKPRLSLRGVSGLDTLISGAYIEIEPGKGLPRDHFVGLEKPPVIKASEAGRKITLIAEKLGSLDTGSPIYYQGIAAGEVLGYELGNDRKSIYIHAFIKSPLDELIQSNTRFWNVSGMDVSLSADGFRMRTQSMQSLLFGGIAFETPKTNEPISDDIDSLVFTLYDNYASIQEFSYTRKIKFVLFFDSSVRGLGMGAPVEFKGIKIGSVVDVHLEYDSNNTSFRIPVVIEIEPERIIEKGNHEGISPYDTLQKLVDKGLRAQLATGSLLTGQLFVQLDMYPGSPRLLSDGETAYPELPTTPGGISAITSSLQAFAGKLEKIAVDEIGQELLKTLKGTSKIVESPDLNNAIKNLKNILHALDASNMDEAIKSAKVVIKETQTTIGLLNNMLRPDSPAQHSIIQMTQELEETARSIRSLVDLLERNPESLIFGKKLKAN